jgi:hypothetical protein
MSNIRQRLTKLGLLLAVLAILCLGVVACSDYSNPGNGSPSSTPNSGGY